MVGKIIVVFLSLIVLLKAKGNCPDANGKIQDSDDGGVPCVLVPGCNNMTGALTQLATQCPNNLPDADCEAIFPCNPRPSGSPPSTPNCVKTDPGSNTLPENLPFVRAVACVSPSLQDIALKCAKTCGLCCLSPEYNCADDTSSPINCTQNINKCQDANWINIMAQYCPQTCGLCANGTCIDLLSGCNTMTALCRHINWQNYMNTNCARTCQVCNTTTTSSTSSCVDIASNCAPNANLCTNSVYRTLMLQRCCATCSRTSLSSSCSDIISNCAQYAYLCTNPTYRSLMIQKCCATCSRTSLSSSSVISSSCSDSSTSCSIWLTNGFCSSTFYTAAQKRQYCARTCNLC